MKPEQRLFYIKIGIAVASALLVLDWFVIEPGLARWKEQGERIAVLRKNVNDGQKLVDREKNLRDRWAGMVRENLPTDDSEAENAAYKAIARWERDARVVFTSLAKDRDWKSHEVSFTGFAKDKPWRPEDTGYETLEFTISINGDQASIGRFIYEMENDTIPVSLEKCDITSHDTRGTQLTLAATFSFLRLPQP